MNEPRVTDEEAQQIEKIRHELTLPVQSQFIRDDVRWLLSLVDRLLDK